VEKVGPPKSEKILYYAVQKYKAGNHWILLFALDITGYNVCTFRRAVKGKGKFHPITGYEGPEGE
jgi:hypothetical protein